MHEPIDPVAGHIPGAKNLFFKTHLTQEGVLANKEDIRARFMEWNKDNREVVVYCGSGVTACCNILAMEYAGIPNAKLYVGSWSEWCQHPQNPIGKY